MRRRSGDRRPARIIRPAAACCCARPPILSAQCTALPLCGYVARDGGDRTRARHLARSGGDPTRTGKKRGEALPPPFWAGSGAPLLPRPLSPALTVVAPPAGPDPFFRAMLSASARLWLLVFSHTHTGVIQLQSALYVSVASLRARQAPHLRKACVSSTALASNPRAPLRTRALS